MRRTLVVSVATVTLLAPAGVARAGAVAAPSVITGFTVATTALGTLRISGWLAAPGAQVAGKHLVLEAADASRRSWYVVSLPKAPVTKPDGSFTASYGFIAYPHGYYRVRFDGDDTVAAARSGEVRDTRADTRVRGWKASRHKIRKGSRVTFHGMLLQKSGTSWTPLKHQRVYIIGRMRGSKTWYWYARPKTNGKGVFKARFRVSRDTYFTFQYYGDRTHYTEVPTVETFVNVR
ncbi:hypothetical protein [Actinomadura rayongensis]|uniref:Tat pathway signal sequence domain protein n=1 Tax=Actinomadura rayongensis TaxID=1429076 RepID=A0A6I4W087_9ACTN|nr:hypothetical protein [Actinomadura rayongensis]MXQ62933.1 hypothetical protein [Actinomadura rayongensis]